MGNKSESTGHGQKKVKAGGGGRGMKAFRAQLCCKPMIRPQGSVVDP